MTGHLPSRPAPDPTKPLMSAWAAASFAGAIIDAEPSRAAAADQRAASVAETLGMYGVDLNDRSTRATLIAAIDVLVRSAAARGVLPVPREEMSAIQQACRHAARRNLA